MRGSIIGLALTLVVVMASPTSAYSVLTHEAAIDVTWDTTLRPLLLQRFPGTSAEALVRARSFAYGGSVIQDLGYYPFGNRFFSNLVHYVRSGDFVEALLREARDVDELAFALGALAHYSNDTNGHPEAVNLTVPMVFPKLQQKYGDTVTYAQAPRQHVVVEFSFDIVHAAAGAYLPDTMKRFIGFRVATPLLERAFRSTYGLEMKDLFADQDRAIATYRYAVSQMIPSLTAAAWDEKHDEIAKITPAIDRSAFVVAYPPRRLRARVRPGLSDGRDSSHASLGVLYRILPKIGPLKPLSFKAPNAEAAALFAQSFRDATARFRADVRELRERRLRSGTRTSTPAVPAASASTPWPTRPTPSCSTTLSDRQFKGMPAALRRNIVAFYGDRPEPVLGGPEGAQTLGSRRALPAGASSGLRPKGGVERRMSECRVSHAI